jgi:uncharacterized protein YcbK (DUF882 family)
MKRLVAILALTLPLFSPQARADGDHRLLWLRNVQSGEELRVRPFGPHGLPERRAWRRITHLFQTGRAERRTISPRLLRTLAQMHRHFGGYRMDLYSGYRVPDDGLDLESYHHVGHAADEWVAGIQPRELFEYCRDLQAGTDEGLGCGLYPRRPFVHVDARGRSVIWVDLGHRSYVSDPTRWLRAHPDAGRK